MEVYCIAYWNVNVRKYFLTIIHMSIFLYVFLLTEACINNIRKNLSDNPRAVVKAFYRRIKVIPFFEKRFQSIFFIIINLDKIL